MVKDEKEPGWFDKVFSSNIKKPDAEPNLSSQDTATDFSRQAAAPDLTNDHSVYAEFVNYYKLSRDERLLLMLAIIPHIQPHLLDVFFSANKTLGRGYTEFGGIKGSRHSGFIPTIETALFLLAGNDLAYRFRLYKLFDPDHIFNRTSNYSDRTERRERTILQQPDSSDGRICRFLYHWAYSQTAVQHGLPGQTDNHRHELG